MDYNLQKNLYNCKFFSPYFLEKSLILPKFFSNLRNLPKTPEVFPLFQMKVAVQRADPLQLLF